MASERADNRVDEDVRKELERQRTVIRYLRTSAAAASKLSSLLDLDRVLRTVVETLVADLDSALACIWLYDPEANALNLRASAGTSSQSRRTPRVHIDVALQPSRIGEVARTLRPFIRNGLAGDPELDLDLVGQEAMAAVVAFPLVAAGELRGVLASVSSYSLPDELIEALSSFASIATASINNVMLLEREHVARAEAEEAVRVRDEFLSTVSHDLKNPLSAIKGRAQMLRRRAMKLPAEEAERFIESLDSIDTVTTRMARLINDLVDLARLRIGQPLDLNYETVDLLQLVRAVVAEQQESTANHVIQVETDVDSLVGEWDRFRIERVIANLLNNAIKYSPAGGDIVVKVHLAVEGNRDSAVVDVQDRGIGIPAADVPRIFQRYYRGSNVADTILGTGVGVAGAKQIIEQHHGEITVDSCEGEGTTFTVKLPLHRSREP